MPTHDLTDNLLPGSTVRIDIGGIPNGTGFFVSTALVVTCAHVLDPYLGVAEGGRPSLVVVDRGTNPHEIVPEPKLDRDRDLALLQLKTADTSVPVAFLNEAYDLDDELYSFGFPENKPNGDPSTFRVEGTSGGLLPNIKFKTGQVRPGMSGAPLLNLRTGAVCGIVKSTRDERQDLGGYGIRVSTLMSAFEDLRRENTKAQRADTRWFDQLSAEQRRRVQQAPSPATPAEYLEFVISVREQDEQWYVSSSTPAGAQVSVLVDLNAVRTEVPRLFRAWKAQGRVDDAEQARLLGHVLYRSIIPKEIAAELERLALQEKRMVHVSLCFAPGMDTDLVHLPWEQLYVQGHGTISASLGDAPRLTFTRVLEAEPDPAPLAPSPEVSVLVLTPRVRDSPSDVDGIRRKLVAELQAVKNLVVDDNGELSQENLEARLARDPVTIIHYIGFGRYENQKDEIALAAADIGHADYLAGDQLAQLLFVNPPTLVILQTCAQPSVVPADPTVLARQLLDAGVSAVVAFPFPVLPEDAALASKRLYEGLMQGQSIRVAVQDARRSLRRVQWSRPALFMQHPADIRLVDAAQPPPATTATPWGM